MVVSFCPADLIAQHTIGAPSISPHAGNVSSNVVVPSVEESTTTPLRRSSRVGVGLPPVLEQEKVTPSPATKFSLLGELVRVTEAGGPVSGGKKQDNLFFSSVRKEVPKERSSVEFVVHLE